MNGYRRHGIHTHTHTHTRTHTHTGTLLSHKKELSNAIAATWMDPETIVTK